MNSYFWTLDIETNGVGSAYSTHADISIGGTQYSYQIQDVTRQSASGLDNGSYSVRMRADESQNDALARDVGRGSICVVKYYRKDQHGTITTLITYNGYVTTSVYEDITDLWQVVIQGVSTLSKPENRTYDIANTVLSAGGGGDGVYIDPEELEDGLLV